MKRHIMVCCLLAALATHVRGQRCVVRDLYLTKPDSFVLFARYPAELEVSGTGLPVNNIGIGIDTAKFEVSRYIPENSRDTVYFKVFPTSGALSGKVPFSIKNKASGNIIRKMYFSYIPELIDPVACIGNTIHGTISKTDLLKQETIRIRYSHPLLNFPYYVISFIFSANFNGNAYKICCTGNQLNQLEAIFKQIPPHTKIVFEHILSSCGDCTIRSMANIELTVL